MRVKHALSTIVMLFGIFAFTHPALAVYSPQLGRWLTVDPQSDPAYQLGISQMESLGQFTPTDGYSDGMNLYQTERSNPIRYVDPYGMDSYSLTRGNGDSTCDCPCIQPGNDCSIIGTFINPGDEVKITNTSGNVVLNNKFGKPRNDAFGVPILIELVSASGKDVRKCRLHQIITRTTYFWGFQQRKSPYSVQVNTDDFSSSQLGGANDNFTYGGSWLLDRPTAYSIDGSKIKWQGWDYVEDANGKPSQYGPTFSWGFTAISSDPLKAGKLIKGGFNSGSWGTQQIAKY